MKPDTQPAKRKWRRYAAIAMGLVLVWLAFGLPDAIRAHHRRAESLVMAKALQSLPPSLWNGVEAYRADAKKNGKLMPDELPLQELVATGHLQPADLGQLNGAKAYISLVADETMPNSTLIRVLVQDNFQIALLSDGSVQMLQTRHRSASSTNP